MPIFGRKREHTMAETTTGIVAEFLEALVERDVPRALERVADNVAVIVHGPGINHVGSDTLRGVLSDLVDAFPDLRITVKKVVTTGDSATAEIKVEGTQAAAYAGAINQEKHLDLDEAWHFRVTDGQISLVDAYWCQQQLYRRLGVKRFDQVSIV
jgi:steroid delta-isomerase-like uncharacterized protein